MLDSNSNTQTTPTFLKVLCILTFIGSGFNLIGGLTNALNGSSESAKIELQQSIDESVEKMYNSVPEEYESIIEEFKTFSDASIENMQNYGASSFLVHALALVGAFLMLRQKRNGFYLYSVSQIALVAIIPIFFPINFIGGIQLGWTLLLAIVWLIMYGTQVKYMH